MAAKPEVRQHEPVVALLRRLATRKLLVVSGKGGVGRTTLAAMLGVAIADRGRRVLVATTGHDDRLAWMLGADALRDEPTEVAPGLFVQRLEAQRCIREYGALVLRSNRFSEAVFDNRVVRRLLRAIPGLDDFAVIGKAWHEAIRGGSYDTVVFDGAATGHLLYALGVPKAILDTIPKGPLTKEAELMQSSFEDPSRVEAVLVGLPETWPLTELAELGASLRERLRMNVAGIVVNGLWPARPEPLEVPNAALDPTGTVAPMLQRISEVTAVGQRQRASIERWSRSEAARGCGAEAFVLLPWAWGGVHDIESLRGLWRSAVAQASQESASA